jgi:hypothetical protein
MSVIICWNVSHYAPEDSHCCVNLILQFNISFALTINGIRANPVTALFKLFHPPKIQEVLQRHKHAFLIQSVYGGTEVL